VIAAYNQTKRSNEAAYMPTEEEIAEAARRIREEGFIGIRKVTLWDKQRKRKVWARVQQVYPPWSEEDYIKRGQGIIDSNVTRRRGK